MARGKWLPKSFQVLRVDLSALFGRKEGLCSFRGFRCDRNILKHAQPAAAVPREDARGPPVSSTTGRISTIFYSTSAVKSLLGTPRPPSGIWQATR